MTESEDLSAPSTGLATDGSEERNGTSEQGVPQNEEWVEVRTGSRPGSTYIRHKVSKKGPAANLVSEIDTPELSLSPVGKLIARTKRFLIGTPLANAALTNERLTKVKALAVLSSDALSSVAYATEAIMATLVVAGTGFLSFNISISIGIALLLTIVAFSYRQTIFAYPNGGGAFIVAKENLGIKVGLVAAAALLIDYILTVSVSVSAGVAAVTSAFSNLQPYTVPIGVTLTLLIMVANLRGVRESGSIFAVPTYVFIVSFVGLILVGIYRVLFTHVAPLPAPHDAIKVTESFGLFLILRAFASGCTALTGVEAISNGVPAFKKPESRNAAQTLVAMVTILALTFMGISFLAAKLNVIPIDPLSKNYETVVSVITRQLFGTGWFYYLIQASTALILTLAANTSFADFPRLSYLLARDKFLPHQFRNRGDRLAFSTGILALGVISAAIYAAYGGITDALLPLYAIGVFLSFTLSQSGMVVHWWRERKAGWQRSAAINGLGAFATGIVLLDLCVTKFLEGAWLVIVLIPLIVLLLLAIHSHYKYVANRLSLAGLTPSSFAWDREHQHNLVIVPIASLNQLTLRTLNYARSLSDDVVAVHIAWEGEPTDALRTRWEQWVKNTRLIIIDSPYRSLINPLLGYIDMLRVKNPDQTMMVILPEFIIAHWWENVLHNQTALRLKAALLFRPGVVLLSYPYHLRKKDQPVSSPTD